MSYRAVAKSLGGLEEEAGFTARKDKKGRKGQKGVKAFCPFLPFLSFFALKPASLRPCLG
jgi:hypothetical protein